MADRIPGEAPLDEPPLSPLAGTRAQALQRLQVGISLLLGIVLIVGLANVIEERAKQSEQTAVPQAEASVAAETAIPANDPLADAGVLPADGATTGPADDGT
ncbi:hypothetical protein ACWPM1_04965 [Tsuneonella sp. HG249]